MQYLIRVVLTVQSEWRTDIFNGYYAYVTDGYTALQITQALYLNTSDAGKYSMGIRIKEKNATDYAQQIYYNVAGYCMKLMNSENSSFKAMATATYYYGVAAAKYNGTSNIYKELDEFLEN